MDPQQIALVKASFLDAAASPDSLAGVFYDLLFTAAPELRTLFAGDRREQERKLTAELRAIVDRLDHVDELIARTRELGKRHVAYGVRAEHYDLVGEALIDALAIVLGLRLSPEAERAWRYAYNLVAEAMQQQGGLPCWEDERVG
jgi:hemoglobin-like flavoprotein